MVFNMITAISFVVLLGTTTALSTTTRSTTGGSSTTPLNPFDDGRQGNAGARGMMCKKSLDAVHEFAADMVAKAMRTTTADEYETEAGQGKFTIKAPRVTESDFGRFSYDLVAPNNIESRFRDGRLEANGVWQFKPTNGDVVGGTYEARIDDLRLNVTNQFVRGNDARPTIKMQRCVADLSGLRVEMRGNPGKAFIVTKLLAITKASNNSGSNDSHVIENCDMEGCVKIRKHYEAHICRLWQGFMDEVINKELQQIPVKMNIHGDQHRVDYSLLQRESIMVNESSDCVQAGMEGKYLWRNSYGVKFSPAPMEWSNMDRMFTFLVSDFTFNTLLHQAHSGGHRFSASDLSPTSSSSSTSSSPTTTTSTTSAPSTRTRGDQDHSPSLSLNCGEMEAKARPKTKSTKTTRSTTPNTDSTSNGTTAKSTPKSVFLGNRRTSSSSTMTTMASTLESESESSSSSQAPANVRRARPTKSTKSTTTRSTTSKSTKAPKSSRTPKTTTPRTSSSSSTTKSSSTTRQRRHGAKLRAMEKPSHQCMGSLFANASNFGPYEANDTGDIVFKTERPLAIVIGTDKNGSFDITRGVLEFYGAAGKGQNGQRPLLARAEIRSMRGQFVPKLNNANITGMFKLDRLELAQSRGSQRSSSSDGFDLEAAAAFSKPWIERMLNTFLERYAQFPVPLPSKYECASPSITIRPRTIQLDCDIRQGQCESQPTCRCFRDSCVCSEPCEPNDPPKGIYKSGKRGKGGH